MNPTVSAEERIKKLLKRSKPTEAKGLEFISPEEVTNLAKQEKESKRRKEGNKKVIVDAATDKRNEEWKKAKKDTRDTISFLPMGSFIKSKNIRVTGPVITPMMVEFFHDYLNTFKEIKRIAVIGFNSGYTTETFLTARSDISVVAFDVIKKAYTGLCCNYMSEKYTSRFMLIGGITQETVLFLNKILSQKRFDMIYIDSGSFPTTAKEDLSISRYLAHDKTVVTMENVKPYSNTGQEPYEAWNTMVREGSLIEDRDPEVWEDLNRCVCIGHFVPDSIAKPLRDGEKSRVQQFWETDPRAKLWKYGNELKETQDPEKAKEIWERMTKDNVEPDETAFNFYITVLRKGTDFCYREEIQRIEKLRDEKEMEWKCLFNKH